MANYKVTLKQVYKDGRDTEILYPETKSDCVVTTMTESGVSPASQTGQALTANVNLNMTLDIINKYLTNMQKYVFNALGTSVAASSSASIPASMQALDGVNDELEILRNVVGLTAGGTNKPSSGVDIMSYIGIRTTGYNNYYVRRNSSGTAFEFVAPANVSVGSASVANQALGVASGGSLQQTLNSISSTLSSHSSDLLNRTSENKLDSAMESDGNYYIRLWETYPARQNVHSVKLNDMVRRIMYTYIFNAKFDLRVGYCDANLAGVMYGSEFPYAIRYWSNQEYSKGNASGLHSTAYHAFTIPEYPTSKYLLFTANIEGGNLLGDNITFYPICRLVIIAAKNYPTRTRTYCLGSDAGSQLVNQDERDFDCKLVFEAVPNMSANTQASGTWTTVGKSTPQYYLSNFGEYLSWLNYDFDNNRISMLLNLSKGSPFYEYNKISFGGIATDYHAFSDMRLSLHDSAIAYNTSWDTLLSYGYSY